MGVVADKAGLQLELRALLTSDLNQVSQTYLPATLAADATKAWPVFLASQDVQVVGAYHVPQATITGADTNSFNLNLINAGKNGAGTTEVGHVDYTSGTDAVAFGAVSLGVTPFTLAAGAVLTAQREKVGTGLAMPEGVVVIVYRYL